MDPSSHVLTGSDRSLFPNGRLEQLLAAIRFAIENRTVVVALQLWQRTADLASLPFDLHLSAVDAISELSLNASFGFVPFFPADQALADQPLYSVEDVARVREQARKFRWERHSSQPNDFQIPDWEQAYRKHIVELEDAVLAGSSFLSVDVVSHSGDLQRGHRGVLGKLAVRQAFRPFVLIPSRRGISRAAATLFDSVDLLIVNIQGLRGVRALTTVQNVLSARGERRSTIIVASSPTDLIAAGLDKLDVDLPLISIGNSPMTNDVAVMPVSEDRHLADRNFQFAVEGLRGRSQELDYFIDLARSAWWATQQSVGDNTQIEPELARLINALDRATSNPSNDLQLLVEGKELICQAAADSHRAYVRRAAIIQSALCTEGSSGVLVIARGNGVTRLRTEISNSLAVSEDALLELGVHVESPYSHSAGNVTSVAIVSGYFGLSTFDKVFASKASTVRFIFDSTEARAAWYGARRISQCLRKFHLEDAAETVEGFAAKIAESIPSNLRPASADIEIGRSWFTFPDAGQGKDNLGVLRELLNDEVLVCLTDGTQLEVGENVRFDVLGSVGSRIRAVKATELNPGDEIVILQEDARSLFSERLMKTLDDGILKEAVEQRHLWLMLVKLDSSTKKLSALTLSRRMAALGHPVTSATVRSWIKFDEESEAKVPENWTRFLAFATAVGISIQEDLLKKTFEAIRRLRIRHRAAGRHLARAIRAAYLNRLDAYAINRIKREWGLDVLQLMNSARLGVVDDVVLPRGKIDHAVNGF